TALGLLLVVPLSFGPLRVGPVHLILHPIVAGAVLLIAGWQTTLLGVLLRVTARLPEGVHDRLADLVRRRLTLERVLLARGVPLLGGLALGLAITVRWAASGFGPLDAFRQATAALTMFVVGMQTIVTAFVYAYFLPDRYAGGVAVSDRDGPDGEGAEG